MLSHLKTYRDHTISNYSHQEGLPGNMVFEDGERLEGERKESFE